MKIIKTLSLLVAGSLLVASCTTYGQASAGFAGAALGSHIGRDIGFLAGGHHHFGGGNAALGSLIGAGIGAALGVGIQSSIENSQQQRYQQQYQNNRTSTDDYQTSGGGYSTNRSNSSSSSSFGYEGSYSNKSTAVSNSFVTVEQLNYMDGDGDGYMSKGETIEVETYITNNTNSTLPNVSIRLNSSDDNIALSSPLITTLSPGQKIRYTGRIYCKKARSNNAAQVSVTVSTSGQNLSTNALPIYMK